MLFSAQASVQAIFPPPFRTNTLYIMSGSGITYLCEAHPQVQIVREPFLSFFQDVQKVYPHIFPAPMNRRVNCALLE